MDEELNLWHVLAPVAPSLAYQPLMMRLMVPMAVHAACFRWSGHAWRGPRPSLPRGASAPPLPAPPTNVTCSGTVRHAASSMTH